jgi:Arc/MetJ family transcription regulator
MRTTIVLDDALIARAQELTGIKTKRAVVEEGLRMLILLKEQAEMRNLRGRVKWERYLDQVRQSCLTDR